MAEPTINEVLEEGIRINRELNEKKNRLNEIKDILREEATAQRTGTQSPVELTTEDGEHTVSVSFPTDSYKIKADIDKMYTIKADVGELLFAMFFKENTKFSVDSDFEENVVKVSDPLQRQALEGVVERKPGTPRITFPK